MNQDNDNSAGGEPIASLSNLEQEVSPQFMASIRKKIYRRTAANQMAAFSWNLPKVILMEMIRLAAYFFSGRKDGKVKQ
jgi:hypothetical protein